MTEAKFPASLLKQGALGHVIYFLLMFVLSLALLFILNTIGQSLFGISVSFVNSVTLALAIAAINTWSISKALKKAEKR